MKFLKDINKKMVMKRRESKNENNIIDHGGRYRFTLRWRN